MAKRSSPRRIGLAIGGITTAAILLPVAGIVALAGTGQDTSSEVLGTIDGIPPRVLQAYQAAGGWCDGLDWIMLAAVGGVESNHGQTGGAQADPITGEVRPWIFGPPLDGTRGRARIPIGRWTGWWGLTGPWQQAVGPMQFLPATFEAHAVDADGDGHTNPHDIGDAVATAANYICTAAGGHVNGLDHVARIYNPGGGNAYAAQLHGEYERIQDALSSGLASGGNTVAGPDGPIRIVNVYGVEINAAIADQFRVLVEHARTSGFELAQGSTGYRSTDRQIELRRSNCGSSHYAIYEMPASQCSPPTARPGQSMHELGLAIDFVCNGALIRSRSNPCFQWLNTHAASYGLYNLPSEPWHWSTNGQ